jgi:hypothetical protein
VNAADVRLGDVRVHLHLGEVLRDLEQLGSLEAGRHGLPHVDAARHHHAVHRRRDVRVAEVDAGFRELRLGLLHGGLVERELGFRLG